MHGGLSTGPRTPEGLERCRRARWRHGRYAVGAREKAMAEAIAELAKMREALGDRVAEAIVKVSRRGWRVRVVTEDVFKKYKPIVRGWTKEARALRRKRRAAARRRGWI